MFDLIYLKHIYYTIFLNINYSRKNICKTKKYGKIRHRLYYEFVEFIRIIDEKDMDKAKEMLDISITVSEIIEEARKSIKVVFGCEE